MNKYKTVYTYMKNLIVVENADNKQYCHKDCSFCNPYNYCWLFKDFADLRLKICKELFYDEVKIKGQ